MIDFDRMGGLYDQDLVLWTEEQARELRVAANAGWNAPIDWENVAEEIESLGKSERRTLASHIAERDRASVEAAGIAERLNLYAGGAKQSDARGARSR